MTTIVVGSISGSPGATRLAVGLAASWPAGRRTLIEADPDGGRLGAQLGVGVEPGLMALAAVARTSRLGADDIVERGGATVSDWHLVPAPASPEQAHSALAHAAAALAETTVAAPDDAWIVDAGRLSPRSPVLPLAIRADEVLLVTSGSFPALQLVPHRVEALRRAGCSVAVVVVEPTWWASAEVATFVEADVAAVLPQARSRGDDVRAMRSAGWRGWWRVVTHLAERYAGAQPAKAERDASGNDAEREETPLDEVRR